MTDTEDRMPEHLARELAELRAGRVAIERKADALSLRNALMSIAIHSGVAPVAFDDLHARAVAAGFIWENGAIVAKTAGGAVYRNKSGEPVTPLDFLEEQRVKAPHLFDPRFGGRLHQVKQ